MVYSNTLVKEFSSNNSSEDLAKKVNEFITNSKIDVIDIQFSTSSSQDKYSTSVTRYYMVWYRKYASLTED